MKDLNDIWQEQAKEGNQVIIKDKLEDILNFDCYLGTNTRLNKKLFFINFHSKIDLEIFKNLRFKGVVINVFEDVDYDKQLMFLLYDDSLVEIFILFIQTLLDKLKISKTHEDAVKQIYNVLLNWKKLFANINKQGLSIELQKGLIGELLVLINFIESNNPNYYDIILSWTGPDFSEKDFTFRQFDCEVKMSTSKEPKVRITNEYQLNRIEDKELYLINIITKTDSSSSMTLIYLIDKVRELLQDNIKALVLFNNKLENLGYSDLDKEDYTQSYSVISINSYNVLDDFPRLTSDIIPNGVFQCSYFIEHSAIEDFRFDFENIIKKLDGQSL